MRDPESMIREKEENQDKERECFKKSRAKCCWEILQDVDWRALTWLSVGKVPGDLTQSCFSEVLKEDARFG